MREVNEKDYELAFNIIVTAGEARATAIEAIDAASKLDFESYEQLINKAQEQYVDCHKIQTDMLNKEASGEKNDVNIFLVHAQDHLTMASMTIENAKQYKRLYEEIKELKER